MGNISRACWKGSTIKAHNTNLPDVIVIEPKVWRDERGYFFESYREDFFKELLPHVSFVQENESQSSIGVLRGLHYQIAPHSQGKLIRVAKGKILDVAVDLRKGSPAFGRHFSIILDDENKKQLFIPRGFAHGFVTLSEETVIQYKVDDYYSREHERGIRFDDPILGIDWGVPLDIIILSEKDDALPYLEDADLFD